MVSFSVLGMTCGHCVRSIRAAIHAADADAEVSVDLGAHLVDVGSRRLDAQAVAAAIEQAGYTAVPTEMSMATGRAQPIAAARGCCCG